MTKRPIKPISRRDFVKGLTAGALVAPILNSAPSFAAVEAPYVKNTRAVRRAIVIGMDGMDPTLVRAMIDRGELPAFKKLSQRGMFSNLRTTTPPQSPVAWASFITGADPGVHGIFDFVHRLPESLTPYLSTSRSFDAAKTMRLGNWTIPISGGEIKLMRRGVALWDALAQAGVPSTVIQIPSNYPVSSTDPLVKAISGMGTPDLLGTYGTFTMYTDQPLPPTAHLKEGTWQSVKLDDNKLEVALEGPINSYSAARAPVSIKLKIDRDPYEKIIRVNIDGHEVILEQGAWSSWIPVSFPMLSLISSTRGMVRLYAKEVHPGFILYVSPINVDPLHPDLPICHPSHFAAELADETGRFYTQGFPADTKALSTGAFTSEEFFNQSRIAFNESIANFEKSLANFTEGLYFFYFSSLDQSSHMLWRMLNPQHPLYEKDAAPKVKSAVTDYYREMDWVLSRALEKENDRTLIIALSDHGFADFTREFNISSWLVKEGFTSLINEDDLGREGKPYEHVDWLESQAYVCGINGIYINRKGRDQFGWVSDDEAAKVKHNIIEKLSKVRDPKTGKQAIVNVYDSEKIYTSPDPRITPDIIIGYDRGYRISDEAVLGKFPKDVFADRTDPWSADHCVDPSVVPGMLISNRTLQSPNPGIWDLAPSILTAFGVDVPKEMTGKPIFKI